MGNQTGIQWCDSTFNPWEGCTKIGPGCDHCYAENRNARFGGGVSPNWGPGAPRRRTSETNWKLPIKWNAAQFCQCKECGWRGETDSNCPSCAAEVFSARRRVFCASLADVFDNEVPKIWRSDLFKLISDTPNLDWLILTKRIGIIHKLMDPAAFANMPNIWLGTTIVNQEEAHRDISKLLSIPARIRFLSMEPLIGPVDLSWNGWLEYPTGIDWVIVGGESGPGARAMHPEWARSLRDQCAAAGVPYFFKQWGEWAPYDRGRIDSTELASPRSTDEPLQKFGKKLSGRLLDGQEWNQFPSSAA